MENPYTTIRIDREVHSHLKQLCRQKSFETGNDVDYNQLLREFFLSVQE